MCGVAGIVNANERPVDRERLLRIRDSMTARGPDGAGIWVSERGDVGLAHTRLAILDLSERAAQPMASPDGRLRVVYNGEIYNHPELRSWAEAHGAVYRTDSDTETLLHLYELVGKDFVKRLRGMFAFALWDSRERELVMARDPFGIKPLYYARDNHGLRFASQVKALLAGGESTGLSPAGVASFYLWGYVMEPQTWYRDVRALPAGTLMCWRPGGAPALAQYCDALGPLRDPQEAGEGAGSLREALLDSVRHHLLADVPVGFFLSAGVDSGTLLSLASECVPPRGLRAVTLAFDEYTGTARDEAPAAREVALSFRASHKVVTYRRDDFLREREALVAAMDQPTVDGSNTYFVSMAAAEQGLKAAISGVGGDEMFAGYPSFRQVPRLVKGVSRFPRRMGRVIRGALGPLLERVTSPKYAGLLEYGGSVAGAYLLRRAMFMPWELPGLMGEAEAAQGLGELQLEHTLGGIVDGIADVHDQVTALEVSVYLRNCLLRDADWAGMAHSLEIRTPLVDAVLFRELAGLRRATNFGRPWAKGDLARSVDGEIPSSFVARRKTGFNIPVVEWASGARAEAPTVPGATLRGRRAWACQLAEAF